MPWVTSTFTSLNSISPQGGSILIVRSINSKPSGEGTSAELSSQLATVLVTHKDQNNKNNPIGAVPEVEDPEKSRVSRRVKLLSGAELKKQLDEAKACPEPSRRADLETALKTLGHPETLLQCQLLP